MSNIQTVLQIAIGFILLWVLFYFGVRPYREDAIRHRLFELRDELFLFAINGGISFDSPAYSILRGRINALIRFAHTITLSRILIFGWVRDSINEYTGKQQHRWAEGLKCLPEPSRVTVEDISNRVQLATFRHLLWGNPFTVVIYAAAFLSGTEKEEELKRARDWKIALIEEQASVAQSSERDQELQPA